MGKFTGLIALFALLGALGWHLTGQPKGAGVPAAAGDETEEVAPKSILTMPKLSRHDSSQAKAANELISDAVSGSVAAAGLGAMDKPGSAEAIAADTVEEDAAKPLK
jgi:hypothetical protein